MRLFPLLFLVFSLSACGLKAAPVAPESKPEDVRRLDCSPQDPECDVQDPNYKPRRRR